MTLDKLYDLVKNADYPIRTREDIELILQNEKFKFEGNLYDAKDVALSIEKFPIKSPADFMKFFIEGFEEYGEKEVKNLGKAMT